MSTYSFSRVSAILLGLTIIVATSYPVLANDLPEASRNATPVVGTPKKTLLQQRLELKKETLDSQLVIMKEKLASQAANLKLKLQAFRDQKKALIAERVNNNLNTINQNRTKLMQKHLDTMSSILDKLEVRVNQPTPDIKNPAAAKVAIAAAREAIATTSAAVIAQAKNDYTIQLTSESQVRKDAKTQRDKLFNDLLALRKQVVVAKKAVANAIRVAKTGPALPGAESGKEGTTSGQQ